MAKVKEGDTISIHYTGKLEDGSVFDSSEGGAPLEFKVGGGEFLKGLEDGVIGMEAGDEKDNQNTRRRRIRHLHGRKGF